MGAHTHRGARNTFITRTHVHTRAHVHTHTHIGASSSYIGLGRLTICVPRLLVCTLSEDSKASLGSTSSPSRSGYRSRYLWHATRGSCNNALHNN